MQNYHSPEHGYYAMTRQCLVKVRKRTGFTWLYKIEDRLERHTPDVRPGMVRTGLIDDID